MLTCISGMIFWCNFFKEDFNRTSLRLLDKKKIHECYSWAECCPKKSNEPDMGWFGLMWSDPTPCGILKSNGWKNILTIIIIIVRLLHLQWQHFQNSCGSHLTSLYEQTRCQLSLGSPEFGLIWINCADAAVQHWWCISHVLNNHKVFNVQ